MDKIKINIGGVITELDKEFVSGALEAGELNIENENLIAYDKDSFEAFKKNLANTEYKNGKSAGEEMLIKTGREKLGLEFEGKSFDNFTEAFRSKVLEEAKIEPSKKIQELTSDLEKIRGNYSELENQFNGFKTQVETEKTTAKKDSIFLNAMPKEGLEVSPRIALLALRNESGIDIDFDENNNVVVKRNGEILKDEKTLNPVGLDFVLPGELESLGLIKKPRGGNGGGDDPGNGNQSGTYEKFEEEMIKKDISPGSLEFQQEMNKRLKEKTLKI